jgi:hypothetical protein
MESHKETIPENEQPTMQFVASVINYDDEVKVKAYINTHNTELKIKLTTCIMKSTIQELAGHYDTSSLARLITLSLLSVLDALKPEDAETIRNIRRENLPNLNKLN